MKYSVLMSVYKKDNPDFLKLALESVYDQQRRKPDEIVVVFDGPLTEQLYAILDAFREGKEQVVFYYPQAENKGLGEALRIGSGHCTGDYIFRMDSDDISHPKRFELQSEYMESHPEIDVLGADIAEFCHDSREENQRRRACPEKHEDIVRMGKRRNPMNHVTVCIKKAALEKCGGYENVLLLEDYYLWTKMIASGCRLANIREALVHVRIGNGFYARRGKKARIKGWKTLQKYMLSHGMISKADAAMNMIYVVGFTYCPEIIRKFVYTYFLRT